MQDTSSTYAPYTDSRKVELSFSFGVVAPDAADLAQPSSSAQSAVSQIAQTVDGIEQMSGKYTSLETNMWILDGTMELYPGTQVGWHGNEISGGDKIFSANPWLEFDFSEPQDSYGFTLIFDDTQPDNFPSQVVTTVYNSSGSQINTLTTQPDSYTHIINLPTQGYSRVRFEFQGTNIPNRRIRICEVKFGVEYVYNESNIQSVTVRQSVSPWAESLASSEVSATIDNSNKLYNMLNPDGLYTYLQDGQYMEWQMIINGEPIQMGRSYFTSAESEEKGLTANITFNDRFFVMDNIPYTGGQSGTWTLQNAVSDILEASGTGLAAIFEGNVGQTTIRKCFPQNVSTREALRMAAQAAMCACFIDRQNYVHFFTPVVSSAPDDIWTKDIQYEDAQIKVGELYNVVQLTVDNEYASNTDPTIFTAKNVTEGDFERVFEVSNPVVNDGDTVAQWLLSWIQRRVSYEVTVRGNPALDVLDTVQINDIYGINSNAILTQLDYTYDGGLECDAAAIR